MITLCSRRIDLVSQNILNLNQLCYKTVIIQIVYWNCRNLHDCMIVDEIPTLTPLKLKAFAICIDQPGQFEYLENEYSNLVQRVNWSTNKTLDYVTFLILQKKCQK